MSLLSQQYDAAAYKLQTIDANIASTQAAIANDRHQVTSDRKNLSNAAIRNYVNDGAAASQNPIFSNNKTASARPTSTPRSPWATLTWPSPICTPPRIRWAPKRRSCSHSATKRKTP